MNNLQNIDDQSFTDLISQCIEKNGLGSLSKRKKLWLMINNIKPYAYIEYECKI